MNKLIATMSFPAMLSMLIQALYNIVDSIFVSRISENALAAVTLVFPIQMLMISVGVGTGVGLSSLIARRLGQKRFGDANDSAMHGFMIAIINWIVFALFGLLGIGPFIRLFSDDPELIWLAVRFGTIVTVGSPFVFMQINIEKTLQATGNMLFPMIFNIVGAVTNIILNPILIFGMFGAPALGIAGSATATVISQFLAMSLALFMFFGFKHAVKPNFREFRPKRRIFSDIYSVGLPSIVMQAIMSFTISGMNAILMQFTSTAVAVLGVYFRIQSLIFMPVFGLNQGVLPIIGYNFGARNKARLLECYKKACFVAVTIMLIGMTAFQLFPLQILHIFNASPDMLHIGSRALKIISICFVPAGFAIVSTTLFQALGHGVLSMLLSLMRQLLLILPFCYLLARFWGVDYVWFCYPMAEIFTVALLCFYVRRVYRKEIKNL
ncbi:MAG: MATE family efflux transporter [Clostridiales Family XIII bacterium]|nr:MATE family efflux transporter [Clostridiales Family XIII bacterium]